MRTRPKILIVDDEILIARELEVRLQALDYMVAGVATSGEEAIDLAIQTRPDLVLMDIVLKGDLDGIEAAQEIRRRLKVPVIYVTAFTDRKTLDRAKVTEPFGYIVKPFTERELYANIEMALYKDRIQRRLRRIERWFTEFIEGNPFAVIAADAAGKITIINAEAEEITEWEREDAVGRELNEVLRLVRKDGTPIPLMDAVEAPVVCLGDETLLVGKRQKTVPVDNTTTCIRDEEDHPSGLVSVFRDASGQRHQALSALASDVGLATAQAVTLRGMLQMCAEAIVRHLNAAFARIWTLNPAGDLLQLQASAGMYTHLNGPHGRIHVGELKIGLIARERTPILTNKVLEDPHITDPDWARRESMVAFAGYPLQVDDHVLGVLGMFSRQPLPEAVLDSLAASAQTIAVGIERKRLEERLLQSQKMEAIGQLAGGIAHDFNNLLTVISGCSQLLMDAEDIDGTSKHLVRDILEAGERAASLTRQLLTFSRRQITAPRVLDLNALIRNLEKMLCRLMGEDIDLATFLDPALERVKADPGQMEQVIMNLAVNARDAMPDGGKLTIETRNVLLDETYVSSHPGVASGNYAMVSVSDTGSGMSSDIMAHLFEPFFTTKEIGKGTGLGLATVYGILKQSGGHIEVYSEKGIGTTFKYYLPALEKQSTVDTSDQDSFGALPTGKETILLVEDDKSVRSLCRRILEECGYTILEAENGQAALAVCEKHSGPIHLVLTDVVMPELGGRSFAERVTAIRPGIPILYMSGYTDDAVIRHGVLPADSAFMQKPFTPYKLASTVRNLLGQAEHDT